MSKISIILLTIAALFYLMLVRGNYGNTSEENINSQDWVESGPLELSPERGRYSLMMSLVDNRSLFFSLPIAKFATPDLGYKNGKYVSLFAPGVSVLIAPGYILGKYLGISQVGAYSVISLFAILNFFLIILICGRVGVNKQAGLVGAFLFLYATPAFAYGVSLYQHHVSTFLILLSIYILLRWSSFKSLFVVWFLFAFSIPIDYPNIFLMFPIAIWGAGKFLEVSFGKNLLIINVNFKKMLALLGVVVPLGLFFVFNKLSYGNPLTLSGTVANVQEINDQGLPTVPKSASFEDVEKFTANSDVSSKKTTVHFFKTRNILAGLYLHLMSPDRGILFYAPVVLFGIVGMYFFRKRNSSLGLVMVSIVLLNLFVYSMWGDPWGGWAFGSRYMIPSYALLCIFLSSLLSHMVNRKWFLVLLCLVGFYSISVNTLGAITTSRNPPQVEILALEQVTGRIEKYTYERNWEVLKDGGIKTYIYKSLLKDKISPVVFCGLLVMVLSSLLAYFVFTVYKEKYDSKD